MFGVIVAGRLVQTEFQQLSETQFVFNIPDANDINHIVVFLTGVQPFPATHGGAVYFSLANPTGTAGWQLLGHITNQKPSAIFKIGNLSKAGEVTTNHPFGNVALNHVAQIGISVEPLQTLALQTPATNTIPTTADSFTEYSQRMLENFINYASSFSIGSAQMMSTESYVPMRVLQSWYETFQRRLQQNPLFWKN